MGTAIIVLAAGASRRMGQPKQLLPVNGVTMLRRATDHALGSRACAVAVVLGANEEAMREELAGLPIALVSNPNWNAGMGASIRAGVDAVRDNVDISSVLLTVADAPGLTAETYSRIIAAHRASGLPIVASQYAGTVGVPVLFAREFFDSLLALRPEEGCKPLVVAHAERAMRLPCPEAAVDIDTPEDFEKLTHPA